MINLTNPIDAFWWLVANLYMFTLWFAIIVIAQHLVVTWALPALYARNQARRWAKAGFPDGDPDSRCAVVAFSRHFFNPWLPRRLRIFVKCYAGWIELEAQRWVGIRFEIHEDLDDNTAPDDCAMALDLKANKWHVVTVAIPDTLVWADYMGSTPHPLQFAREILRVPTAKAPNWVALWWYLHAHRKAAIKPVTAPTGRMFPQQRATMTERKQQVLPPGQAA